MDVRSDFPFFENNSDEPIIYLDNAATTQKPKPVLDSLIEFYSKNNSNIHRGVYRLAENATDQFENVRKSISSFINSEDSSQIIFTKGTTESINLVAYSWGRKFLKQGDEILISEMEHHSNIVPWKMVSECTGAKLKFIPINNIGELDEPIKYINKKTKLISIIHQSNVLGTINNLDEIITCARNYNCKVLIDGAQSISHMSIDVRKMGCDFFVFSGHKMMAPTGVGVLYAKRELLEMMDPFLTGGEMINSVTKEDVSYNILPWKFEAGTPNIAQVIGLGSAIDYIRKIGLDKIKNQCNFLLNTAINKISKIDGISIYGNSKNKGPIITFNIENVHPYDLAQLLDQKNICIRAGHHCTQPLMNRLNISSSARVSFYIYNTEDEIDILLDGINKSISLLR